MGAAQSSGVSNETSTVEETSLSSQDDVTEELVRLSAGLESCGKPRTEESETCGDADNNSDGPTDAIDGNSDLLTDAIDGNSDRETQEERLKRKQAEMDAFYNEVVNKREARNKALGDIAKKLRKMEKMEEELEKEREEKQTLELHCKALKEVNKITKEMLRIRETQVSDLKLRLKDVEKKLMESPEEIKVEYEKQMSNYKKLRELYEQRAVAADLEHKTMIEKELAKNALLEAKLKEIQEEIQTQLEKYQENKKQIIEMEKNIKSKDDEINNLNESLTSSLAENHILNSQMTLVNNLFSNMLINPMINLDLLIKLIQDNYLLIIDLINNHEINDTVSLLVDLEKKIDQETLDVHNEKQIKQLDISEGASCSEAKDKSAEALEQDKTSESSVLDKSHIQKEIADNLPKVWRILIELLNTNQEHYENNEANENFDSCYKNIITDSGKTHQVISVSQTFIRLKHLILEKNHLTNQLAKLKTLNNHLEIRLNQSEQRLNTVTTELKKTWNVVNKLKLQHKQLYTHEKILKYELKHKRNIINDLKIDLEYVREKWDLVKEKNIQNEIDYNVLRKEFALRRLQYDGGRSTSESGISTDNEDDNVEIVETNDESEDDKSEVVETQSEHDVPRTNSVMSIEEDDHDEVEELESESNGNDSREVQNITDESLIETTVFESANVQNSIEHEEVVAILETSEQTDTSLSDYTDNNNTVTTDITRLEEEEDNKRTTPKSILQENGRKTDEDEKRSEEKLSQIICNNRITVKSIGGKIKIVTEHLSEESSASQSNLMKAESSQNISIQEDQGVSSNETMISYNKESFVKDKCNIMESSDENQSASQSVSEVCGEQRIKLLTRQDRIVEEPSDAQEVSSTNSTTRIKETHIGDFQGKSELSEESSKDLVNTVQSKVDEIKRVLLARRRSNTNASSNFSSASPDSQTQTSGSAQIGPAHNFGKTNPESIESAEELKEHELVERKAIQLPQSTDSTEEIATSSHNTTLPETMPCRTRTPEEILEARNARLKRLEDQTKNLFHKMSLTSQRSDTLSERLVELHEYYGSSNDRSDRSPRRQREGSNDSIETQLKSTEQDGAQSSATSLGISSDKVQDKVTSQAASISEAVESSSDLRVAVPEPSDESQSSDEV